MWSGRFVCAAGGREVVFGCEIHPSETCSFGHSWHSDLWDAWDSSVFFLYVGGLLRTFMLEGSHQQALMNRNHIPSNLGGHGKEQDRQQTLLSYICK